MNRALLMAGVLALALAAVPAVNANDTLNELLAQLTEGSGASASCGQYSVSAHGWGSGASASAEMTVTTDSYASGSDNDAYAGASGYGGGSASAHGGPWYAYCNSALLGIIGPIGSDAGLACRTGGPVTAFDGDVLRSEAGALFASNGAMTFALDGIVDLGSAATVALPSGLADTGVDVHYSSGPSGCLAIAQ